MGRVVKALLRNAVSIIIGELSIVYLGRQRNRDQEGEKERQIKKGKKKESARNSQVFTMGKIDVGSLNERKGLTARKDLFHFCTMCNHFS